jgi:putative ABC transport system permease protein
MRFVSGWRLALRLAWREAWRSKARSVLVLVMVTFPVVAVIAADVAQATQSVSSVEGLDRRIGSAEAKITTLPHVDQVFQTADPDGGGFGAQGGHGPAASLADIERALGGPRPATEIRTGEVGIRTDLGVLQVDATGLDLGSPLTRGLYRLTSGRLPTRPGEIAVNAALAGHGFGVGDRLTIGQDTTATIVGIAESTGIRTFPVVVGPLDLLPGHGQRVWLVGGAPIGWDQVRAVDALGGVVLSRQVVEHPPSPDELSPQARDALSNGDSSALYAVLALVGVMALIEVVLLAGPAFAVGARRQSRSLALIAANGGTPTQSRRVILGTAVVIGALAALVGLVLGIGLGRALLSPLQAKSDTYFGPFQIRWDHVLGIAAFGLLSAFLAAVVPAWIASRQDVVAVLAGRRGDRAASRRSPVIGVVLVAAGVVLAVVGSRKSSGEVLIAGAAVLSIFGMIFLVPVVVLGVARLGRRFPLPLRYAVRDAARHRTRTVPAVAAVAATVAGVVALSIGNTSDQAQAKADYTQELPIGEASVSQVPSREWPQVRQIVHDQLPGVTATDVVGTGGPGSGQEPLDFRVPGHPRYSYGYAMQFPAQLLVGSDALSFVPIEDDALARAQSVLRRGGAVVMTNEPVSATTVQVSVRHGRSIEVPAAYVDFGANGTAPMLGIVSRTLAHRLGMPTRAVGLHLHGSYISTADQDRLAQAFGAVSPRLQLYVEHGYQVPSSEMVVLWILFGLAGVLMLGGTLTATFLALSDARPDLATLSAVGASPRMRRAVAAAYAVAVGIVGAALGAAVGFVPGIAVSYPLTRPYNVGDSGPSHYLVIPWLEIGGLVLLLPLVTALVVGLLARSRLPLVARLD